MIWQVDVDIAFADPEGANLKVDLLVPTIPVPALKAHAKGLPYLAYRRHVD